MAVRSQGEAQGREGNDGGRETPRLVASNEGLVARNLGKSFKKRPVLRDVCIGLQRGEAVGLLGPNGAGKTTCFYCITGLISPDYGEIRLDGVDVTNLPMYRRARAGIGYLPQEPSIFRGLTVEQNIRAVLEMVERDRERREAMVEELLAEFSITHLRRTPSIALSGGRARRREVTESTVVATRPVWSPATKVWLPVISARLSRNARFCAMSASACSAGRWLACSVRMAPARRPAFTASPG